MIKRFAIVIVALASSISMSACVPQMLMERLADGKQKESSLEESVDVAAEVSEEGTSEESSEETNVFVSSGLHFGSGFDADEMDYQYLYAETLMSDSKENPETGKMESANLSIALPQGDYNTVNRDYGRGSKLGVEVYVTMDPFLQYKYEDYTLRENLDDFLSRQYDAFISVDYKDLSITDAEGDESMASASVEYIRYNKYDDDYSVVQEVWQLYDLGYEKPVMVSVSVNGEETTGKTPELLKEINDFYNMDLQWDADAMEQKKEAFLSSNNGDVLQVSNGWMIFELPKGWSEDWKNNSDYMSDMYAPDGDGYGNACYITVGREFQDYSNKIDISALVEDEKNLQALKDAMAEAADLDAEDITVSNYGMTVLGEAVELTYTISVGDISYEQHRWMMSDNRYIYQVVAAQVNGTKEDAISVAQKILSEGKVKGSDM